MKKITAFIFSGLFVLLINSCASTPVAVVPRPDNYIAVGTTYEKLKGHEFYSGIGQTDKGKKGKSANTAVAVCVDSETGQVLQIVTMRPQYSETLGKTTLSVGNLEGGLVLVDFESHDKWLAAIESMQEAFRKLYPDINDEQNSADTDAHVYFDFGMWPWGPLCGPGSCPW